MRPRKVIVLIFLVLLAKLCFGQDLYPSKKIIQRLFTTSIQQDSKKKVQVGSNAWIACNIDSAFFKADTIAFYKSGSSECCSTVQWTFFRKNAFVQNMAQTCKEPSSATVTSVDDFFTIDLIDEETSVVMRTIDRAGNRNRFRVIEVHKENRYIKLVRIR